MKPLMGQVQSQLNLDDLFSSSRDVTGNFGRPSGQMPSRGATSSGKPSFSEVLLRNLDRKDNAPQAKTHRAHSETKAKFDAQPVATSKSRPNQTSMETTPPRETPLKSSPNPRTDSSHETSNSPSGLTQTAKDDRSTSKQNPRDAAISVSAAGSQSSNRSVSEKSNPEKVDPALVPLQKQFGDKATAENIVNNNAILSFITGRLDRLQLETLPSLLNDSALIKQVLSSSDVNQFLNSPTSINDLANLLEIDQKILTAAARDGLNPSEFVKPQDFIKALGINPAQVAAELTTLKQTLPTGGVEAYLERAQAITALKQNIDLSAQAASEGSKKKFAQGFADKTQSANLALDPMQGTSSSEQNLAASLAQSAFAQAVSNAASVNTNSTSNKNDLLLGIEEQQNYSPISDPTNLLNLNMAEQISGDIGTFTSQVPIDPNNSTEDRLVLEPALNVAPSESSENDISMAFRAGVNPILSQLANSRWTNAQTQNAQPSTDATASIESDSLDSRALEFSTASVDPFAAIGEQIDSENSTKIEFSGNGLSNRSLEEILIDRHVRSDIREINLSKGSEATASPLDQVPVDISTPNVESNTNEFRSQSDTIDVAQAVSNLTSDKLLEGSGNSFNGESESSLFESPQDNTSTIFTHDKSNTSKDSVVTFESKLTTQSPATPRESLAQKILGQAEMMFKNGGGAMRMNMEAPGIGKVDVAINLNNNQLDVRIMTVTDQARDIISREVAGLRDGLTQQGLSLRGLEVGKAGEASSRNFAGQSNQSFGQGAQDQKATYNDMKEYVQSFRNSYAPRNPDRLMGSTPAIDRLASFAARSGSRLEVRV